MAGRRSPQADARMSLTVTLVALSVTMVSAWSRRCSSSGGETTSSSSFLRSFMSFLLRRGRRRWCLFFHLLSNEINLITHLILNILWLGDFANYCLSNIAVENRSVNTYRCYLCAFLSPCSSTLMISGSRWAGSLGLSRYSKTFLPYLLLMTSSRDDRISWTGGNQARPEFNTVTSTFHPTSFHFYST